MKKIISVSLICLGVAGFFTLSCSKQQAPTPLSNESATFEVLKGRIVNYNADFTHSHGIIHTKARGKFWKVLACDAAGAAVGAVGGVGGSIWAGICASYGATKVDWVSVPDVYAIDVIDTGKSNWLDSVSSVSLGFGLFSSEYMVGAEHNRIITKISSENPEIYDNQFGDVTGLVYDEVLTPIQLNGCATRNDSWIDPNPGNTFYVPLEDVIENIVLTTNNGQYPINTLVADYPQFANEISVLESFCDVIEAINNIADLELYTTGFIQILDSSQISPESISAIKTGMAVAIHSKYLWAE